MGLCVSKPDGRYEAGSADAAGPKPSPPEPPTQGLEVDKFDESTAAGSKTAQNRLAQGLSGGDSMRRQGENAPTSDGSAKISGRLPSERLFESSATEFWDKSELLHASPCRICSLNFFVTLQWARWPLWIQTIPCVRGC